MEYRKLGNSGLKVSALSIGAWLTYGENVGLDAAAPVLRKAVEHGVNFIDVADIYAYGRAEEIVGKVVKDYKRSDLVISTKAYWPMSDNVNDRGLSRKHIIESVNQSLKRFDMDYVDIFFCHRFDPDTPLDESLRAIDDLIHQGKVLYWGTSMWTAANINDGIGVVKAINMSRPITEQPVYNMLDRDAVEGELETSVTNHGMGLVIWSPLAQGVLTGKYNDGIPADSRAKASHIDWEWFKQQVTEERVSKVRALTALAREMGTSMSALALAWGMRHPNVSSVITGATKVSQVEENLKALDVQITDEIEARIEAILQNKPQGSHR